MRDTLNRLRRIGPYGTLTGWFRRQSYLLKMLLAVLVLVALVASMGLIIVEETQGLIAEETREELKRTSKHQGMQMETWLQSMRRQASLLTTADQVQDGTVDAITAYLEDQQGDVPQSVVAIHYVEFGANGAHVLTSTVESDRGTTVTTQDVPWADTRDSLENGSGYVSEVYERQNSANEALAFVEPVAGNASRAIVLVTDLGTAALNFRAPQKGQTFVFDHDGTIFLSTNPKDIGDDAFEKGYVNERAMAVAHTETSNMFVTAQYTDEVRYGGTKHLTAMTHLSTRDLVAVSQSPADIAFLVRNRVRSLLLLLVGGVLLVGIAVVGTLGVTTVRDLRRLSEKARAIERGEFDVSLETDREDELGEAYRSVDGMRDALAAQIREVALVENASDLITVVEPDGTIRYQSPSARRVLGVEPEEMEGKNLADLAHPDDHDRVVGTLDRQASNPDGEARFEFRLELPDDGWHHFEGVCENLLDHPFVDGLVVSSRDITQRKRHERELQRQRDQMEFFNSVLRHDILNGMHVIRSRGEILEDELDREHSDYADAIVRWSESIVELTQKVRRVLDTLTAEDDVELRAVNLTEVVRSELDRIRAMDESVTAEADVPPGVTVKADDMLSEVLGNVLTNAVEHNDTEGLVVTVSVEDGPETVTVEIADNGSGIDDERKEKIFQRGETSASSGSGFGLFFVQSMAEVYGADLDVRDNDPTGTVFVFEFNAA